MKNIVVLYFLISCFSLDAQTKVEKEYQIEPKEVPTTAVQWLAETFDRTKKLKWYFEENSGRKSYEAKFCFRKRKYSVEFSTTGQLEDIEIEHKWRKLPVDTRQALQTGFNQIAGFKLRRIQEQWTGDQQLIQKSIQQNILQNIKIKYEVEFIGEIDGVTGFWEGLFSQDGQLLKHSRIILPPTDNLDF